jgi:predicted RNase H-like nuclease (RuvC/YqgF family)
MANINMTRIPTNGNCKKVRDITNNISYGSMTETAIAKGVSPQAVSMAVHKGTLCNGCILVLESELHKSTDRLCDQIAKANVRAAKANERATKAEEKLSNYHITKSEMEEFRKWKAEQKAKAEAEAKRLEAERKAEEADRKRKEELAKKISKAKDKVARCEADHERHKAKEQQSANRLMKAQMELEALLDMEV